MTKLGEEGLQKERVEKDKAMFGGREIAGKTLAIIGMGHIGAATAREASALGMETVGTFVFCWRSVKLVLNLHWNALYILLQNGCVISHLHCCTMIGYDPGLSIESALKLPREIQIMDSISSAVAKADYISLNIPYIKGEGGTHGIIGKDVISHMKDDAVLLNFARGELVDSDAMKEFLDRGNGRYISDFPDGESENCIY